MKVEIGPYTDNDENRVVNIEIDDYDLWNVDSTLTLIIHPILVKFRDSKRMGFFTVMNEDLPDELQVDEKKLYSYSSNAEERVSEEMLSKREIYILNEMIYAFENIKNNFEMDVLWDEYDSGKISKEEFMKKVDLHENRKQNGLHLFGKYFQSLWN